MMDYLINIDPSNNEELRKFFKDHEDFSTVELACKYKIPIVTVRLWKRKLGISFVNKKVIELKSFNGHKNTHSKKYPKVTKEEWDNPEWFKDAYLNKKYGVRAIGKITGLSPMTVLNKFKLYDIQTRKYDDVVKSQNKYCSKKWLVDNYIKKYRTARSLAIEANVSQYTITNWLAKFGIMPRYNTVSDNRLRKIIHNKYNVKDAT